VYQSANKGICLLCSQFRSAQGKRLQEYWNIAQPNASTVVCNCTLVADNSKDWSQIHSSATLHAHQWKERERERERKERKGYKQSCSICTEQNEGNFNLAAKQFAICGTVRYFVIFRVLPQRPTNCPTKGRLKIICSPERRFSLSTTTPPHPSPQSHA
jgi:hypothetical protein